MNVTILWAILMCLFCAGPTCAQTNRAIQASQTGKANLIKIKWAALHNQISRCEVFHLPFETSGAIEAGGVEHFHQYRLEIDLLNSRSKLIASLCQAIQETKLSPCAQDLGDFHWGCKLSDDARKKVCSLYVDDTGKIVVINGKKCALKAALTPGSSQTFLLASMVWAIEVITV